ncbi:MAG: copper resistance protein CopC [Cyanobacteria bacterium REEB65]|nr:copper resistance protein CopC [Cyanobacteria bacterium REEB65]
MNRILVPCIAVCLLVLSAKAAGAHAFPTKTDPPVGWTVQVAPKAIRIWYTMGIQPGLGFIEVKSASGQVVSQGPAKVGAPHDSLLVEPLVPLRPGKYFVSWHVLAVDGHPTQGHFAFTFRPASGS